MSIESVAGTTLKISAGVPATFDSAGYSALTYTTVGEITDLGEFGRVYNVIKHNPIGTRGTSKRKGSYDEGALNLKLALDTDDAGQILCKTAAASDANYAVLITAQGGDKYYMQVQVTSFKTMFGSVDNMKSASIDMEITTSSTGVGVVEVLAP